MSNLHPIFRECLTKHAHGFDCRRPFGLLGYVYATDGHVCVRACGDATPQGLRPPVDELPWGMGGEVCSLPANVPHDCAKCCSSGFCLSCDDAGICTCSCGHKHKCESCGGSTKCPECKGTGHTDDPREPFATVTVGPLSMRGETADMLLRHGIREVRVGDGTKFAFAGDGFEGIGIASRTPETAEARR
jgi:hypothetical protein